MNGPLGTAYGLRLVVDVTPRLALRLTINEEEKDHLLSLVVCVCEMSFCFPMR